jgi:hypothetical protein
LASTLEKLGALNSTMTTANNVGHTFSLHLSAKGIYLKINIDHGAYRGDCSKFVGAEIKRLCNVPPDEAYVFAFLLVGSF